MTTGSSLKFPLRVFALVALALAHSACGEAHFEAARRQPRSVAACLRYLAANPSGKRVNTVRRWLDEARFQQARRADRPFAYVRYLELHPRGRHRGAARERLGKLALTDAKEPHEFELILERFGGSPVEVAARNQLGFAYASAALAGKDRRRCEQFLRRFARHPRAAAVRHHLAGLAFATLRDQAGDLETYIQRFAGTPWARKAVARLQARMLETVRSNLDRQALTRYAARFPGSAAIGELRRLVWQRTVRHTVIWQDPGKWAHLGSQIPSVLSAERAAFAWLQKGCLAHRARCLAWQALARRALPWRPTESLKVLVADLYSTDFDRGWRAAAKLGWMPDPRARDALAHALGSARLSTVWMVLPALLRQRSLHPVAFAKFLRARLDVPPRAQNLDEVQRYGALELLSAKGHAARVENASVLSGRLSAVAKDRAHRLVALYLQMLLSEAPQGPAGAFLRASRQRLRQLSQTFPKRLTRENAPIAHLAARELHVLRHALSTAVQHTGQKGVHPLLQRAGGLVHRWSESLRRVKVDFEPAMEPTFQAIAARHEAGRAEALRALRRDRKRGAGAIHAAVCEELGSEGCKIPRRRAR